MDCARVFHVGVVSVTPEKLGRDWNLWRFWSVNKLRNARCWNAHDGTTDLLVRLGRPTARHVVNVGTTDLLVRLSNPTARQVVNDTARPFHKFVGARSIGARSIGARGIDGKHHL
jgi:hypothetical protein